MPNCLTTRTAMPPLDCYFLFQRRNWLVATRRHLENESGLNLLRVDLSVLLDPGRIKSGSVVIVEFPVVNMSTKAFLGLVWQLTIQQIHVVCAENDPENETKLKSMLVGASCVVTNEEDCDKVARLIERARLLQIPELVDWKDAIWRQLPWPRKAVPV